MILYSDERIVVVDKPPGLSLATPPRAPGEAVARLLAALPPGERDEHGLPPGEGAAHGLSPGEGAAWTAGAAPLLVHRLDVGTSGVVLLARDADAHRELCALFERRAVDKRYLALAWGHPRPREGVYDAPLGPDRADRRRMRVDPDGRAARTRYAVRSAPAHVALLELHPETGRTHQIRVHLAHAGHPIVGDDLYGGPRHRGLRDPALRAALDPPHTLLHAARLALPATSWRRGELIFEAPLPPAFARALAALGLPGASGAEGDP